MDLKWCEWRNWVNCHGSRLLQFGTVSLCHLLQDRAHCSQTVWSKYSLGSHSYDTQMFVEIPLRFEINLAFWAYKLLFQHWTQMRVEITLLFQVHLAMFAHKWFVSGPMWLLSHSMSLEALKRRFIRGVPIGVCPNGLALGKKRKRDIVRPIAAARLSCALSNLVYSKLYPCPLDENHPEARNSSTTYEIHINYGIKWHGEANETYFIAVAIRFRWFMAHEWS